MAEGCALGQEGGFATPTARLDYLRARCPTFVYEDYDWGVDEGGGLHCSFRFRMGDLAFQPTCNFTFRGGAGIHPVAREVMDHLVFHLGLAEIPSYWKAACPPRVEVRAGLLQPDQVSFWTRVLTEGMGEFHFVNRTPFTDPLFVTIVADPPESRPTARFDERLEAGHIVPMGGGKDSLVTLDLLARRGESIGTLAINPPPSTEAAVQLAHATEHVVVHRRIDPRLLELNAEGFLNGHTPFGAVIAFVSAVAAVLLRKKHICLSNESSADYAPLSYRNKVINHQHAKSWAFEADLHRYLAEHVAPGLCYFSLLRPFNELQISRRASELTAFHSVLRSCNRGRKTDTWCGRCPKCLSTFLTLAPFLARSRVVEMFGRDLLQDPECESVLSSLLTEEGAQRPFECVATPAELRAALALYRGDRLTEATIEALTQRSSVHLVPDSLYAVADAALRPRLQPLLHRAAVGVVGLGVEGMSTCRHLISSVEPLDLTVIDDEASASDRVPSARSPAQRVRFLAGEQAMASPPSLDIVFRSPGVRSDGALMASVAGRPTIMTSNTELFFEQCTGKTVGVTGTKGKSTTTTLLAHVLSRGGRDARLIGNIGTACLDALEGAAERRDVSTKSETIYCVELSSFQLETLQRSPSIAVVLGIFGDHLDRYPDLDAYVAAKSAITRYQTRHDVVLYNKDCPRATAIAGLGASHKIAFGRDCLSLLGDHPSPLLGEFNNYNIWPAVLVGRLFGMSDAELAASIRSFRPLPGRLETVADKDGVRFVCDIRSTAPEVTIAALDAVAGQGHPVTFLMLGGVERNQDYRGLIPALERSSVRHILLFPPTGARIRRLLEGTPVARRVAFFEPSSMEQAIRHVYRWASEAHEVCLMSTAAPSSGGLFSSPEDKARQFAYWAKQLGRTTRTKATTP